MYGATGIGTGASGAAMYAGVAMSSYLLMTVAAIAMAAMFVQQFHNARRRRADQRP